MDRDLRLLRNLYRAVWPSQSIFGPLNTTVLAQSQHNLEIRGPRTRPIFVFRRRLAARASWLTTFTNGDGQFAIRRSNDMIVDWVLLQNPSSAEQAAAAVRTARLVGREGNPRLVPLPLWLELLPHDSRQTDLAVALGAKRVGTRFTAEGDVIAVHYAGNGTGDEGRFFPTDPAESLALVRLPIRFPNSLLTALTNEISTISATSMVSHYSKKNKGKHWLASSLYGFSGSSDDIAKPSELSHGRVDPKVRPTQLLLERPRLKAAVDSVISHIRPFATERVRLMRLAKGMGGAPSEVERHSDLTDHNHGVRDGRIMRLHVPIFTDPAATVSVWDENGEEQRRHLPAGFVYYLDVRRPHRVLNASPHDRVHLVIDCVANERLRNVLLSGTDLCK